MIAGNYTGAVGDFTFVIEDDSTNSAAFFKKGIAYINLGNKNEGCKNLVKAGELGYIHAYEEIQKYCK